MTIQYIVCGEGGPSMQGVRSRGEKIPVLASKGASEGSTLAHSGTAARIPRVLSAATLRGRLRSFVRSMMPLVKARQPRGTRQQQGYGAAWQLIRRTILIRDPICRDLSGCVRASTDVDHITPRRAGGSDAPPNLQGLCHRHHSVKSFTEDGGDIGAYWPRRRTRRRERG